MTIADFLRTSIFRITMSCTLAFIGALLLLSAVFYFGGTARSSISAWTPARPPGAKASDTA